MSNMSYCRFRNTLTDLIDCQRNFENISSESELDAAKKMIRICKEIVEKFNGDDLRLEGAEDE